MPTSPTIGLWSNVDNDTLRELKVKRENLINQLIAKGGRDIELAEEIDYLDRLIEFESGSGFLVCIRVVPREFEADPQSWTWDDFLNEEFVEIISCKEIVEKLDEKTIAPLTPTHE